MIFIRINKITSNTFQKKFSGNAAFEFSTIEEANQVISTSFRLINVETIIDFELTFSLKIL